MTFFSKCKIENVIIDSIDLNDIEFKISKPLGDDRLKESIRSSGILEMPVLFKENNLYKIIFGHNRLSIIKELNLSKAGTGLFCYIAQEPDPELFIGYAVLKNFRGEFGATGKSKFILILKNKFCLDENDIALAAKKMQIPDEFLLAGNLEKVLSLPEPLKNYLDLKSIGFKIVKNILRLSKDACILFSNWLIVIDIRVNIFKSIVDLMVDIDKINRTENILAKLAIIDPMAGDFNDSVKKNSIRKDEMLFREIFKVRYPEYTNIKLKAENIINEMVENGLEIYFPEYFEKDEIGILLKINKRNKIEGFNKMISRINVDALKKLLELL
jgi:hypothetical protein